MDPNNQLIETLKRSETFQKYEHAYVEMNGLPLALRPVETWQLPFHGKRKENEFCALMAANSHTCAACLQLQATLTQAAMEQPATRTCIYGLCETAVPVKLGGQTIGFLQTGQVMRQKPTGASFRRAVARAKVLGVDIDNEPVKQAYFKTPVDSEKKLDSAAKLLAIFAEHLAMKSNQIVTQTANAESPVIGRAKQFIREHHMDHLSLRQVAVGMNMSRFYFCKQFHKATGLSFTEFVSRTRIEKAEGLLLNPNLRVSEIAFAVGFQSLTNFNRAFKRYTRQSPSGYRSHLAGYSRGPSSQMVAKQRRDPVPAIVAIRSDHERAAGPRLFNAARQFPPAAP